MDEKDKDRKDEWPDDDRVIYIPDAEYHSFMRSLLNLEQVQKEFHKIRDSKKIHLAAPVGGLENKIENFPE